MLSIWGIAKRANELFQGNEMILFGEIDTTMILQCTRDYVVKKYISITGRGWKFDYKSLCLRV